MLRETGVCAQILIQEDKCSTMEFGTEFRVLLKSNKDSGLLGSLVCFYNTVFPLILDSGV